MTYYYDNYTPIRYDGQYLAHHGIKGQKWGVRRFQNSDGSLTDAGKRRYGGGSGLGSVNPSNKGFIRRWATGDHPLGMKRIADRYEEHLKKQVDRNREQGLDTTKAEQRYERQKQMNIDRDKYLSNTKTYKIIGQNFLMGGIGGHLYRNARARGDDRVNAFVAPLLGLAINPLVGLGVDSFKKKTDYSISQKSN